MYGNNLLFDHSTGDANVKVKLSNNLNSASVGGVVNRTVRIPPLYMAHGASADLV
jgi:hypothetical protein